MLGFGGKGSNPFLSAIQKDEEMMNFFVFSLFSRTFYGEKLHTLTGVRGGP